MLIQMPLDGGYVFAGGLLFIEMRKAFNFYRSYYDVVCQLNDSDKLKFLMALLEKQFNGVEPKLTGMSLFAYSSQKHSIDAQVVGYEVKTGNKLHPMQGGSVGGCKGGSVQGKGEEKGEEEEQEEFNFKNSLLSFGFEKSLVSDWLKVRKKKNLTNTEVAFNDFVNEINKRPNVDKNEVLKYIVIKSWGGFKWEWYDKEKPQSKQPQEQKTLLWYDFWDIPAYDKYCKENNITPDYTTKPNGK